MEKSWSEFVYTLGLYLPACGHKSEQLETVGNSQDLCSYHSAFV